MNDDLLKSLREQLTPKERVILADLWESDARAALTKLLGLRQLQIAQLVLKSSADHYYTTENRGRSLELNYLTHVLSSNLKASNNDRKT